MPTPNDQQPEEVESFRRIKITFEGAHAHTAFMMTAAAIMQALYEQVGKVEMIAHQLGNVQIPQIQLPMPQQLEHQLNNLNGRNLNGVAKQ